MRINVYNLPLNLQNAQYNTAVRILVDEIFDGNSMNKKFGYVVSNNTNFANNGNKTLYHISQILSKDNSKTERSFANINDEIIVGSDYINPDISVGPVELGLINCLLSNNKVTVITGALGSGKTELINYVCYLLREHKIHCNCNVNRHCGVKKDMQIIIDFNGLSIVGEDEYNIKRQFFLLYFTN